MLHPRIKLESTGCFLLKLEGIYIFFADPLGKKLCDYHLVYKKMRRSIHEGNQLLMKKRIQSADLVLRGLYCTYVARVIITKKIPMGFKLNDHELIRFAKRMLI